MPFSYDSAIFSLPTEVQCLCTIVKNVSTAPYFVLLPKHGTTIGANEQIVFVGGLDNWLQTKRYRTRNSVLQAMLDGKLEIVQLPVPHLVDSGGITKTLGINDPGTGYQVTFNDPCWKPGP